MPRNNCEAWFAGKRGEDCYLCHFTLENHLNSVFSVYLYSHPETRDEIEGPTSNYFNSILTFWWVTEIEICAELQSAQTRLRKLYPRLNCSENEILRGFRTKNASEAPGFPIQCAIDIAPQSSTIFTHVTTEVFIHAWHLHLILFIMKTYL